MKKVNEIATSASEKVKKSSPRVISVLFVFILGLSLILSCKTKSVNLHYEQTKAEPKAKTLLKCRVENNFGRPIAGNPVIIAKLDGTIVSTGITNTKGEFIIQTSLGNYERLRIETLIHGVKCSKPLLASKHKQSIVFRGNDYKPMVDAIDLEKMMSEPGYINASYQKPKSPSRAIFHNISTHPVNYSVTYSKAPYFHRDSLKWKERIKQLNDDGYSDTISLGFNFPFFNRVFSSFFIASNGFIGFEDRSHYNLQYNLPIGYEIASKHNFRDGIAPKNIIAWCWDDLKMTCESQIDLYSGAGKFRVKFSNISRFGSNGTISAALTLYESGKIEIEYLSVDPKFETRACTVGLQDENLTKGIQLAHNEPFIESQLYVVCHPISSDQEKIPSIASISDRSPM